MAVLLTQSPSGQPGVLRAQAHTGGLKRTLQIAPFHCKQQLAQLEEVQLVGFSRGSVQTGRRQQRVLSSEVLQQDPHTEVDATSQRLSCAQTTKAAAPVNK